jgi:hypothetical protein
LTVIYVPDSASLLAYKGARGWSQYAGRIKTTGVFDSVVDLVDGIWLDGEITGTGEGQDYRFPVTEGLRYGVWVNDSNGSTTVAAQAGDGTKTLDIGVIAAYEDTSDVIFEPGDGVIYMNLERRYICPEFFTAELSGNVILTVGAKTSGTTGTFAVKYGEIKPIATGAPETGTLAAGGTQWHYFVPDPEALYTVSWEDSGDQAASSSYTGDVTVTAFQMVAPNTIMAYAAPDVSFNPADSGYITPQFMVSSASANVNRIQFIRVEAETGGSYALKFEAPTVTPLNSGTPVSDTIAVGEVKLYSFSPTRNIPYDISWEDSGDQADASSYTGNITVTACRSGSSGTYAAGILFDTVDSGYTTPQTSNLWQSFIYLRVAVKDASSGGTYSIKYQE